MDGYCENSLSYDWNIISLKFKIKSTFLNAPLFALKVKKISDDTLKVTKHKKMYYYSKYGV